MVTAARYRYYLARKERKREEDDLSVINEIAKMKGFKGKKIGEKKTEPSQEYAEFIVRENLGFKGRKKGEKVYGKTLEEDIGPLEEYYLFLGYQQKKSREEEKEYQDYAARREGYKSFADKEEHIAQELGLKVEQYHEYIAKKAGFDSWRDYKAYIDKGRKSIKSIYMSLIPEEEYIKDLEALKNKWLIGHEKFIAFCNEIEKEIRRYFEQNKKNEAAININVLWAEMEKYHQTHPESMNIYSKDEMIIGLDNCLLEKGIDVTMMPNKRFVKFGLLL